MTDQDARYIHGEWTVSIDEDGDVELKLSTMNEDGVEVFITAMPPSNAMEFGEAICGAAREAIDEAT